MSEWTLMLQGKIIKQFTITDGERKIIGRGDDAEVKIDNSAISRHHAALEIQNGKPFLQDLCSLNGTWVNGKQIDFIQITDGDDIKVGKFSLIYGGITDGDESVSAASLPMDFEDATIFAPTKKKAKPNSKKGIYQLQVVAGSCYPKTLSLSGRTSIKIGKSDNSDLITPGFFISANHCFISLREDGFHLVPQKTFIKTKVNDQPVSEQYKLKAGDEIKIRDHLIRFEQL